MKYYKEYYNSNYILVVLKKTNFQILLKVKIKWLQICENLKFAHI